MTRTVMAGVWTSELLERKRQTQANPRNLESASQPHKQPRYALSLLLHTTHLGSTFGSSQSSLPSAILTRCSCLLTSGQDSPQNDSPVCTSQCVEKAPSVRGIRIFSRSAKCGVRLALLCCRERTEGLVTGDIKLQHVDPSPSSRHQLSGSPSRRLALPSCPTSRNTKMCSKRR